MALSEWEPVVLGGVTQWVHSTGTDPRKPVLLFLHGGPGTPETAWLAHCNRVLRDDFVVVCWEQRGAGKSYPAGQARPEAMTGAQLLADTLALTRLLQARFDRERILLLGHSWGTVLALRAAARCPQAYLGVVSVAQVSHALREETVMHAWALDQARARGQRRARRQLEALGSPVEHGLSLGGTRVRLRWVNRFGGGMAHRPGTRRRLMGVLARSGVYTPWDKVRYLRAEAFTLAHLYDELARVDLFAEVREIEVPVWFVHGRHDQQVPLAVARDYAAALSAPEVRLVVFDRSAHSPLFEQPARFHRLMRRIRDVRATVAGALR